MSQVEVANIEDQDDTRESTKTVVSSARPSDVHDDDDDETEAAMKEKNCQNNCNNVKEKDSFCFSDIESANLECLRKFNEQFIQARNWDQFHSPRNVLLALVGEVGELAEIFQWKGEVSEGLPELSQAERDHVGEEISDILIYLIDFASRCRIDLPKAVASKIAANAVKYPVDKSYGQANKYTDYT